MSVGEAFLSAALGVLCERMASLPVLHFFKSQQLNAPLKKLKNKLTIINRVLDDAEDKRHTDPFVKQWHDELKDVVYDAEDLLDEIASEVQRSEIEAQSQTSLQKAQDFASSHNPFKRRKNERLEKILETLEDLVDQKDALGLMDGIGGKPSYQRTPTTWIPDESVVYGRDDDKEAIMKWVLSDHPNISNPDVLAIVGHGGLGKTTLAQHVYVSSTVPDCFDKKSWVCVAEEFDVFKVTKDILVGFTNKSSNADNLNQLQSELMLVLTDQKFFLVLDDDWNRDYSKWEDLLKPLKFGRKGSKILVTTRDEAVANITRTSPIYPLQKLSGDDCWSLFEKHASLGTDMPSTHRDLVWIGKQIVKKCDGLPLAAKVIGGALRGKRESKDWKNILESDMWDLANDNILPVLKISYQFLQSELKRCFAYCAVFPKDCAIYKEQVIRLWMAEGLLTQSKGNEDIEQVGEGYFDDLVSRSFFQKSERKYIRRGGFLMRKCFLMHDLINDLAKSISGEFCFNGVDRSCEITGRIRHLRTVGWELGKHIFTIKRVRTILLTDWAIEKEVIDRLTTLTRLRVLCSASIYKLPDAIDKLMHLRCLDLSNSTIWRLPDSVVSLWNLETLILFNCQELEELPAKISQLINLSQLDIRRTDLTRMPPHMGKLKKLGELDYYIVGEESDCSIKELGPLERLRGRLLIGNLRNVSQVQESVEANLKGKEKLKKLNLIWNDDEGSDDEGSDDEGGDDEGGEVSSVHERSVLERSEHERSVLEQLQPHTNIEKLRIHGYAGRSFPDWVGRSSFSKMVGLKLTGCKYCDSLPALGQLGSLKRLSIMWLEEIKVVGPEFYGKGNKPPFGCLESLTFEEMPQWTEWVPYSNKDEGDGASAAFPLLQELVIKGCPNLIKTLPVDLPSLKKLTMSNLHEATRLDLGLALEEIDIEECGNLKCLQPPHLPSLTKLRIKQCDSLESFPLDMGPVLEEIEIWNCKGLNCLSAAAELEHLESLQIGNCPNLTEIQLTHLPSLRRVKILRCQSLECFPFYLCQVLQQIEIRECEKLKCLSAAVTAELGHLKSLKIESCPMLEIPHTHLPSLTLLQIWGCDQLVSLPRAPALQQLKIARITEGDRFLRRIGGASRDRNRASHTSLYFPLDLLRIIFPSLSHLELESCCEEVESFPPENVLLPPTLISLAIEDFPNLKSFDSTALQSLTCLQELRIRYCPELQSLPTQGLPSSLKRVEIYKCPSLQVGQDWPFGLLRRLL